MSEDLDLEQIPQSVQDLFVQMKGREAAQILLGAYRVLELKEHITLTVEHDNEYFELSFRKIEKP